MNFLGKEVYMFMGDIVFTKSNAFLNYILYISLYLKAYIFELFLDLRFRKRRFGRGGVGISSLFLAVFPHKRLEIKNSHCFRSSFEKVPQYYCHV